MKAVPAARLGTTATDRAMRQRAVVAALAAVLPPHALLRSRGFTQFEPLPKLPLCRYGWLELPFADSFESSHMLSTLPPQTISPFATGPGMLTGAR